VTYSDKPEPGMDFIALMLILNLGLLALGGWQLVERDILDDPASFILFAASFATALFFTAKTLLGAFDTEYSIEEDLLVLRQGKREETIPLVTINSIKIVDSLWKSFLFTKFGFANRITDLVRLETEDHKFMLSPTHPQLFVSQIRGLLSQSPDYIETTNPATSSPQEQESSG
jgi:hypothetical protein